MSRFPYIRSRNLQRAVCALQRLSPLPPLGSVLFLCSKFRLCNFLYGLWGRVPRAPSPKSYPSTSSSGQPPHVSVDVPAALAVPALAAVSRSAIRRAALRPFLVNRLARPARPPRICLLFPRHAVCCTTEATKSSTTDALRRGGRARRRQLPIAGTAPRRPRPNLGCPRRYSP